MLPLFVKTFFWVGSVVVSFALAVLVLALM